MAKNNPFTVLSLPAESTSDQVIARWRELASTHHPDKGGDPIAFDVFRKAYKEALEISKIPVPCLDCNGSGKKDLKEGWSFYSVKVRCTKCHGKGLIYARPSS